MSKCPICKKEIDYLIIHSDRTATVEFNKDTGKLRFSEERDGSEVEYECPECNYDIFYSEEEVVKFLKGSKQLTAKE